MAFYLDVPPDGQVMKVTERIHSFGQTMNVMHRFHGYGDGPMYNAWAALYDLASLSLIVFAVTGVVLWWKLTKNRLLGWICLLAGAGFTASMVIYLKLW